MLLLNTLATVEQLESTPSRKDGIPQDLEDELRVYGCQLIQQAGILLKLPQVAMATAQVLFQRFWYVTSMKHFSIKDIGMGALFLASKLEESPLRLRDLINVYDYLLLRGLHASTHNSGPRALEKKGRGGDAALSKPASDLSASSPALAFPAFSYTPQSYFSQSFYDVKDALVIAEMQILKRLGFNVQVNLPYATMVNYMQLLGLTDAEKHPGVAQMAWSYLNDALQTPVYCLFPPHVLACASIYLVTLSPATSTFTPPVLPLDPAPWYLLFDVTRSDLRTVSSHLLHLYDAEQGIASRVRDEWGGLAELADKKGVRDWLELNAVDDGGGGRRP